MSASEEQMSEALYYRKGEKGEKQEKPKGRSRLCCIIALVVSAIIATAVVILVVALVAKGSNSSEESGKQSSIGTPESTESDEDKYFNNWGTGRSPEEWKTRSIYQILTDRFARTDGANTTCDLSMQQFCGGTYLGMIKKLDYIKELGFNAIWITNVIKNTPWSYHGYSPENFFSVDYQSHGGPDELKQLIIECHKRDIWVMTDYVYNHAGANYPSGNDVSNIYPFNKWEYYHDFCMMDWSRVDTDDDMCKRCSYAQWLPDLNQDHPFVRQQLLNATHWLLDNYHIDGFRVDMAKHIKVDFFEDLVKEFPRFYFMGEVTYGDPAVLTKYTSVIGSLNFPMWHTIRNVFQYNQTMQNIGWRMNEFKRSGINPAVLGTFLDNHDEPRWLYNNSDWNVLKNALCMCLLSSSIPVMYYGTEQGFKGVGSTRDEWNWRQTLWPSGYNTEHELFKFVQTALKARKLMGVEEQVQAYDAYNFYAFFRGPVLVCMTNSYNKQTYDVTWLPVAFQPPCELIEIFSGKTYTTWKDYGGTWHLGVTMENDLPQVWVPKSLWNSL